MKKATAQPDIAVNRKAPRDYHILERFEAGVELRGTEVKSIRLAPRQHQRCLRTRGKRPGLALRL